MNTSRNARWASAPFSGRLNPDANEVERRLHFQRGSTYQPIEQLVVHIEASEAIQTYQFCVGAQYSAVLPTTSVLTHGLQALATQHSLEFFK